MKAVMINYTSRALNKIREYNIDIQQYENAVKDYIKSTNYEYREDGKTFFHTTLVTETQKYTVMGEILQKGERLIIEAGDIMRGTAEDMELIVTEIELTEEDKEEIKRLRHK